MIEKSNSWPFLSLVNKNLKLKYVEFKFYLCLSQKHVKRQTELAILSLTILQGVVAWEVSTPKIHVLTLTHNISEQVDLETRPLTGN